MGRAWRARRSRVLAENFSDGVVAPILWTALGGLVGGALYKAINTADSMIGHRGERYGAFGWAAARLDDLVNLPASRLAALWLILAAALTRSASAREAARAVGRDAARHRSPNAGWPEAAMAGALGLKLAGPRVYARTLVDDSFMGNGRREADANDIRRALRLYRRACLIAAMAGACCFGWPRAGRAHRADRCAPSRAACGAWRSGGRLARTKRTGLCRMPVLRCGRIRLVFR